MSPLVLVRGHVTQDRAGRAFTPGRLYWETRFLCSTIELPRPFAAGSWEVVDHESEAFGRPMLRVVGPWTNTLLHELGDVTGTRGCVGVGRLVFPGRLRGGAALLDGPWSHGSAGLRERVLCLRAPRIDIVVGYGGLDEPALFEVVSDCMSFAFT